MARKYFCVTMLMLVMILGTSAFAQQSNEVAVVFGRTFISDQKVTGFSLSNNDVHFGKGWSYEGSYAHRFLNAGIFGVGVEVPFLYNPETRLQFGANVVPGSFKSYFITPAVKVNLFPSTAFSPWVSVGAGYGHFSPSDTLEFGGANPGKSTSSGVFQIGGGLDVRIAGGFKLRGEVRDFNSSEMPINVNGKNRYSNIFAGAGIVFSF